MNLRETMSIRPKHLVATTALMAFSVLASIAATLWNWSSLPHPLLGLALYLGLSTPLLWFYWQGYNAVRWIIIVAEATNVLDAFYGLFQIPFLSWASQGIAVSKPKYILQLVVCIYIVGWLLTREAARYFSVDARQERKSLLASVR